MGLTAAPRLAHLAVVALHMSATTTTAAQESEPPESEAELADPTEVLPEDAPEVLPPELADMHRPVEPGAGTATPIQGELAVPTASNGIPTLTRERVEFAHMGRFLHDVRSPPRRLILDDETSTQDEPWNPFDALSSYEPHGNVHLGLQFRGAGAFGKGQYPLFELGGFVDFRLDAQSSWRPRLVVALAYLGYREQYLGAGATHASSPLSLRLRLYPVSFDFDQTFTFRLGAEVGLAWTPRPDFETWGTTGMWGGLTEIAMRFLEGRLEAALGVGFQMTTIGRTTRRGYAEDFFFQGVLSARLGWVFL